MRSWLPVVLYTSMRLGVFLAVWLLLQAVTGLRGLTALVVALLVSGAVSIFLLNGPRQAMSGSVAGFFGRINDRIERATTAEDREASGECQPGGQAQAEAEDREAGEREGRDERPAGGV